MRRHWLLTWGGLLAVGCAGNGLLAPHDGIGRTIERDTTAPVQTDSLVQHVTREGPQSYSVDIPFRFRNDTGQVYSAQFGIHGTVPGTNAWPQFASAELDGEYRLVWGNLVHDYDPSQSGFGVTVGPLHSNPFLLVAPE
jgi:hypothetical protein